MGTQRVPEFLAGDIALCHDKGDRPGLTTAWVTRSRRESPTFAVHSAQWLDADTVIEMGRPGTTKIKSTAEFLANRRAFEVWRDMSLTEL